MRVMTTEELRERQLEILSAVVSFCDTNGVKYFLCGGTLLGAVRHKGYIPWDDDIDLMMLREDYDRFIKLFRNDTLDLLHYDSHKGYPYPFVKVSDKDTLLIESLTPAMEYMGVNIDIFPIDNIPNNVEHQRKLLKEVSVRRKILSFYCCDKRKRSGIEGGIVVRTLKRTVYLSVDILQGILRFEWGYAKRCGEINRMATRLNSSDTVYKGIVVWGYGAKEVCDADIFSGSVEVEFEGKMYCAPLGYDRYLTTVYGDYMTPPPIEKQATHHSFVAYKR